MHAECCNDAELPKDLIRQYKELHQCLPAMSAPILLNSVGFQHGFGHWEVRAR